MNKYLLTIYKGDENMARQDIKALMKLSRDDLKIRQSINNKSIDYKALADSLIIDLKDILTCYDKKHHLSVSLSFLGIYGKLLSDSYKGYILNSCKVLS